MNRIKKIVLNLCRGRLPDTVRHVVVHVVAVDSECSVTEGLAVGGGGARSLLHRVRGSLPPRRLEHFWGLSRTHWRWSYVSYTWFFAYYFVSSRSIT